MRGSFSISLFFHPTEVGILLIPPFSEASTYALIFLSALEKIVDITIFTFFVLTGNFPKNLYTLVLCQLHVLG